MMWFTHSNLLVFVLLWISTLVASQYYDDDQLSARDWADRLGLAERDFFDEHFRRSSLLDTFTTRALVEEVEQRIARRALPKITAANMQELIKKGTGWIKTMTAADTSMLAKFTAKAKAMTPAARKMSKAMADKELAAGKAAEPQLKAKLAAALANKDIVPKGLKV